MNSSQFPPILVEIVGVHHDDYPNIYYTVKPIDKNEKSFLEKQTDRSKLFDIDKNIDSLPISSINGRFVNWIIYFYKHN